MTDNTIPSNNPDEDDIDDVLDGVDLSDEDFLEVMEALPEDSEPVVAQPQEQSAPPSRIKAFIFAALILIVCFTISFILTIPDTAKNILSTKLAEAGFHNAKIETVSLSASSVTATNIKLDQEGFDSIKNLTAKISWPSFFLTKNIKTLEISDLVLTREDKDFRYLMQQAVGNLLKLPQTRTVLKNATFDISTTFGDLRFIMDATIDKPEDADRQLIQAHIRAEQYQLGFDSHWTGIITKNNKISLNSEFVDGKLHFGPLNITRYNGWIGIEAGAQQFSIQAQIDAGGASLFDIPLQNVSFISDIGAMKQTLLFRASLAGMQDVILSADMTLDESRQDGQIVLKGDDLGAMLFHVEQLKKEPKRINETLKEFGPFSLTSKYQPESRFPSGPLPFTLEFLSGDKKQLAGNYLFYFDEMDVRGSVEADPKILPSLRDYFGIGKDLIDGNFIRLDGSVKDLFVKDQG